MFLAMIIMLLALINIICKYIFPVLYLCVTCCLSDQSGKTALHLAAEHGQSEVVEFLIGMGCTHSLKDKVVTHTHNTH